jgi:hypothetical protein
MKRVKTLRWALALAALVVAIIPGAALGSPPSNDYFVNAETIDGRFGWVDGDTTGATKEPVARWTGSIARASSGRRDPPIR